MSVESRAYDIEVGGHLDPHWAESLHTTRLRHTDEGATVFRTEPIDQAQLHGLLARLRDMGVVLGKAAAVEQGTVDAV